MENSTYEILKHRLVCENRYMSVSLDTIGENGKILVEDYMSIGFKTYSKGGITGVLTLPVSNGKYGLVKIYRHPIQGYSWELPGGFLEPNESLIFSALRELKEEVGLSCDASDLVHLGNFYPAPGLISGKACIYSAEKCKFTPQAQKNEFGITQFKWFSGEEIEEYIEKGLIQDMATILAIHRRMKIFKK
jgi:8-oxo-dGTP pyrophosphatase MutT (NUDIX family)